MRWEVREERFRGRQQDLWSPSRRICGQSLEVGVDGLSPEFAVEEGAGRKATVDRELRGEERRLGTLDEMR